MMRAGGEQPGVAGAEQFQGPKRAMTRLHVPDNNGEIFHVEYYNFPEVPEGEPKPNLSDHRIQAALPKLFDMSWRIFPQYSDQTRENFKNKFNRLSEFDLVYDPKSGELVAFHVYETKEVETAVGPVKVVYVDHAGTDTAFEKRGINRNVRNAIFDRTQPDVICGSSANGAIYDLNKQIAAQRGMVLYPQDDPRYPTLYPAISELGQQIVDAFKLEGAITFDPSRLVRTYPLAGGPVSQGKYDHPLKPRIPLGETEHYLYTAVRKPLNNALLARGVQGRK